MTTTGTTSQSSAAALVLTSLWTKLQCGCRSHRHSPTGTMTGCVFYATGDNSKKYITLIFSRRKKQRIVGGFLSFLSAQMSVGAIHSFGSQRSEGSQEGFHGCLENLNYNGLNLIDLAKRKVQQVIPKVMSSDLCGFNCLSQLAGEN